MINKISVLLRPLTFSLVLLSLSCTGLNFKTRPFNELRYNETRYLILTADDFGAAENINKGIRRGIQTGAINSVAALVTFPHAMEEILSLHDDFPAIEIGIHLSITSGTPVLPMDKVPTLVNKDGNFYTIEQIIPRLKQLNLLEVEQELRAQIACFQSRNIPIASLSSQHNLLGIYTPCFEILLNLADEYNIPMRSTIPYSVALKEFSHAKTKRKALNLAKALILKDLPSALSFSKYGTLNEMKSNQNKMDFRGIPHPLYLADVFWGDPTPENLHRILQHLPPGVTELVFHLGFNESVSSIPPGIDGDYYPMREFELLCISSPELSRWMDDLNIKKSSFQELKTYSKYLETK